MTLRFLSVALLSTVGIAALCSLSLVAQEEIKTTGRIVGGEPTTIEEHPWQVAILAIRSNGSSLCGGSIILDDWVLTAAHCFLALGPVTAFRVKWGATDILVEGQWVAGERFETHSLYDSATQENDLALVKLRTKFGQRKIPLAPASMVISAGQELEIAGWGATSEASGAVDRLRKARVQYVDTKVCNKSDAYAGRIKDGMMCAGYRGGKIDSCQGDSGGPLVLGKTIDTALLVGIVSQGEGCARPLRYGVYTRVSAYRDWINGVVTRGEIR